MNEQPIGDIGNYCGGLSVKEEDGKYYWSIENLDGEDWGEIPEYLYEALVKYEAELQPPHQRNERGR